MLLEEAGTCIDGLDGEADDPNPAKVNALFRAVHSLKGVAGMVGLTGIAEAAHDLETLLDDVRMGRVVPTSAAFAAIRGGLTALSSLVSRVAAGEEAPALGERLRTRLDATLLGGRRAPVPEAPVLPPDLDASLSDYERHRVGEATRRSKGLVLVDLDLDFDTFDTGLRTAMAESSAAGELIGTFPGTASDPSRMAFRLLVALPPDTDAAALGERCGARHVRVRGWRSAPRPAAGSGPARPSRRRRRWQRASCAFPWRRSRLSSISQETLRSRAGRSAERFVAPWRGPRTGARGTRRSAPSHSSTGSSRRSVRPPCPSGSCPWRR